MIETKIVEGIGACAATAATLKLSEKISDKFLTKIITDDFDKGMFCGAAAAIAYPYGAAMSKKVYFWAKEKFNKKDISDKKKEEEQKKAKDEEFFKQYESYRAEFETA